MNFSSVKYCPQSRVSYTAEIQYNSDLFSINQTIIYNSELNMLHWCEDLENGGNRYIQLRFIREV